MISRWPEIISMEPPLVGWLHREETERSAAFRRRRWDWHVSVRAPRRLPRPLEIDDVKAEQLLLGLGKGAIEDSTCVRSAQGVCRSGRCKSRGRSPACRFGSALMHPAEVGHHSRILLRRPRHYLGFDVSPTIDLSRERSARHYIAISRRDAPSTQSYGGRFQHHARNFGMAIRLYSRKEPCLIGATPLPPPTPLSSRRRGRLSTRVRAWLGEPPQRVTQTSHWITP